MADTFPRQNARTQRFTLGAPRNFSLTHDDSKVVFLRSRGPEDPVTCLWSIDVASGEEQLLADPTELLADVAGAELPPAERARRERAREGAAGIVGYSADTSGRMLAFALAGRLYVHDGEGEARLLDTSEGVFDPRISPDGRHVSYVAGDELHVVSTVDGAAGRLLAGDDAPTVSWGSAEFIAAEEMRRGRGHWWSPDGDQLIVARVDIDPVDQWHIADPAQPWREPVPIRYPAAGTPNAVVELALLGLVDGARTPVPWDRDLLPYLVDVAWRPDEPLTLVTSTRDQRRMVVFTVDPITGAAEIAVELTDPDWVEIVPGTPRWLDGELLTVVELDGTRALVHGGRRLSEPDQWVRDVVSAADGIVLYTASIDPTEVRLFRVGPAGVDELGELGGVVGAVGGAQVRVVVESRLDRAARATVIGPAGERQVASSAASPLVEPAVDIIQAGERGVQTAILFPADPPDGPLPVLLDPYGGPHAQRVVRSRNAYLTSQWFADQGFCVVVADGRGTPGRGDGWERSVRGDLATPVLDDQVAALDAVAELHGDRLDLDRVGIRGWSFGGYLAALAVLRRPDRFHAAVAGAPVTDWRWYDTHYTERYLGHPDDEPVNYEQTSLIADAAELRRPLMLIHGLADDNVVAAHTLQLSTALLAAGRAHEVLPLSGVTHMTPQEEVAENLLLLQVDFLRRHLARPAPG